MNKTPRCDRRRPLVALALPARGQVKLGGYLSLEYIKGQADSDYSRGDVENLLAGFLARGEIERKFGFTLEARALGVSSFDLVQAWAGFFPSKVFTVRAGLFLVPFGAWNLASRPHETLLIRTPLNLEYLYPASWRELGLVIEGETGGLTYAAYIGNGLAETDGPVQAQQFSDNNADKAKGGRLGLIIGQTIRAGVSYYSGKYDELNQRDLILEGADLTWVTSLWEIHGEYTKGILENPQPFEKGRSEGFAIWTTMKYRTVQPIGSYQKVKFTDSYHAGGIDLDQRRWTAGLRWVVGSALFIKAEYNWNKVVGLDLKTNEFQVQVGLSF
jgi:hypothetical protein